MITFNLLLLIGCFVVLATMRDESQDATCLDPADLSIKYAEGLAKVQ